VGGPGGGFSRLTVDGLHLLGEYERALKRVRRALCEEPFMGEPPEVVVAGWHEPTDTPEQPSPAHPDLSPLLSRAREFSGHNCPGMVLGVRMAVAGLRALGEPLDRPSPRLRAVVETARCATDAVQAVTRCTVGAQRLRVFEHGKMAATFYVGAGGAAVRAVAKESSRDLADRLYPEIRGRKERQMRAYVELPDGALLDVRRVRVKPAECPDDLHERTRAVCELCGETFVARFAATETPRICCRACAGAGYLEMPHWLASRLPAAVCETRPSAQP
jgi:formylmethanofuran dehydrogenase subunit E